MDFFWRVLLGGTKVSEVKGEKTKPGAVLGKVAASHRADSFPGGTSGKRSCLWESMGISFKKRGSF